MAAAESTGKDGSRRPRVGRRWIGRSANGCRSDLFRHPYWAPVSPPDSGQDAESPRVPRHRGGIQADVRYDEPRMVGKSGNSAAGKIGTRLETGPSEPLRGLLDFFNCECYYEPRPGHSVPGARLV